MSGQPAETSAFARRFERLTDAPGQAGGGAGRSVAEAMFESGIILLKRWLEVSPEEQNRRLEARVNDGRKIWKRSAMGLEPAAAGTTAPARDEMFAATELGFAPGFMAKSDSRKRVRLEIISHRLTHIRYQDFPRENVKLPKRQAAGGHKEPDYPCTFVKERF